MKLGAAFPVTEAAGNPDDIRKFVKAMEELGYEHVLTYDHVVKVEHSGREPKLSGPYNETHSFHDPFVLFGFMAALSQTLSFVTGVLVLPQRQTALVAQQAADVDLLSNERLRLGVGIGWNHVEYAAMGHDFKTRGRRMDEQLALLKQLWAQPLVSFDGQFDHIDRGAINPRPRRQIPLWLGGRSEAAYKRAAVFGDGFIFLGENDGAAEEWEHVRRHLNELGHDETAFGRELLALFARSPEESSGTLRTFRDSGGTHGCATSMEMGLGDNMDAHIEYLAEVKRLFDRG